MPDPLESERCDRGSEVARGRRRYIPALRNQSRTRSYAWVRQVVASRLESPCRETHAPPSDRGRRHRAGIALVGERPPAIQVRIGVGRAGLVPGGLFQQALRVAVIPVHATRRTLDGRALGLGPSHLGAHLTPFSLKPRCHSTFELPADPLFAPQAQGTLGCTYLAL